MIKVYSKTQHVTADFTEDDKLTIDVQRSQYNKNRYCVMFYSDSNSNSVHIHLTEDQLSELHTFIKGS